MYNFERLLHVTKSRCVKGVSEWQTLFTYTSILLFFWWNLRKTLFPEETGRSGLPWNASFLSSRKPGAELLFSLHQSLKRPYMWGASLDALPPPLHCHLDNYSPPSFFHQFELFILLCTLFRAGWMGKFCFIYCILCGLRLKWITIKVREALLWSWATLVTWWRYKGNSSYLFTFRLQFFNPPVFVTHLDCNVLFWYIFTLTGLLSWITVLNFDFFNSIAILWNYFKLHSKIPWEISFCYLCW